MIFRYYVREVNTNGAKKSIPVDNKWPKLLHRCIYSGEVDHWNTIAHRFEAHHHISHFHRANQVKFDSP